MCANVSGRRTRARLSLFKAKALARHFLLAAACSAVAAVAMCWPAVGAAAEPGYAIVTEKTKTVKAVDKFEIHGSEITAKAWVLIAAQAPELTGQRDMSTRLVPGGKKWPDLSPQKRVLLRSQIPVTEASLEHSLSGRVEFQATLYSRNLVRREPGKSYSPCEKLSNLERKLALAESETLDFSAASFQSWLRDKDLRKKPDETDLDFGRRAFLAITRSYQYLYSETLDRHVSFTCQHDRSDCGGLAALFAATLRANKIPARLLVGHWAKSEDPNPPPQGRVAHRCHAKGEFYAKDVGWVPVDLSGAVEFDKTPEGLRFFGHEKGDFLTVQLDYDVRYDTGLVGMKTTRHLQNARFHVKGSGNFNSVKIDHNWQVETLP